MAPLTLTIGFNPAPNTQALLDRSVQPAGVDLKIQTHFGEGFDNVGARHRAIIVGKMDGGELSISSFILARLRGVRLRALPVFLSRRFRHRCMYFPVGSPLRDPAELAGRRITVHRYNATTPVWLKGILQNEYGVKPQTVEWLVAEPDIAEESLHPAHENMRSKCSSEERSMLPLSLTPPSPPTPGYAKSFVTTEESRKIIFVAPAPFRSTTLLSCVRKSRSPIPGW